MPSNLPNWPGASNCYSRAYAMLHRMSKAHVAIVKRRCHVSDEMRDLIDALNAGNQEQIKGLLMTYSDRGF